MRALALSTTWDSQWLSWNCAVGGGCRSQRMVCFWWGGGSLSLQIFRSGWLCCMRFFSAKPPNTSSRLQPLEKTIKMVSWYLILSHSQPQGPTYSKFAFLPLEPDSRRPTSSGRPPPGLNPGDCLYGMYHMDKTEDSEYFHFWMGGACKAWNTIFTYFSVLCCLVLFKHASNRGSVSGLFGWRSQLTNIVS